ncbi:hypothetical protein [Streptomyces iranensis]
MPNHHISHYTNGDRPGISVDIYKREYADMLCLIGSATCPVADLTGIYG